MYVLLKPNESQNSVFDRMVGAMTMSLSGVKKNYHLIWSLWEHSLRRKTLLLKFSFEM